MMSSFLWYRIKFNDTKWCFDTIKRNPDVELCTATVDELFSSGLQEIFRPENYIAKILLNMEKKGFISYIEYLMDSRVLGKDIPRCQMLFPDEVFIPTTHQLKVGMMQMTLPPRSVMLKGCQYLSSGKINIGVAEVEPSGLDLLESVKGNAFIGCMDIDAFSATSSSSVSSKPHSPSNGEITTSK
ncbi:TPA_asm: M [Artemisia alphacytorhabdovirus 1]|nr:TPA_asm: M [Artemisia alphacytorhabdovirus 1]